MPSQIKQDAKQDAKQTGFELLTDLPGSQPPINPKTLNPNTLIPDSKKTPLLLVAREAPIGSIFQSYEAEIGAITPTIANEIKTALADYPPGWFQEAFRESARNNKRNWRYALAILKRWKVEGFQSAKRRQATANAPNPAAGSYEAWTKVKKI